MFQSGLFRIQSLLLIIGIIVSAVLSQTDPSAQLQQTPGDQPAVASAPSTAIDNATLNLHRWGAVTLFHGLPSDRVNAIAEDANGLMWFGTDNGLVRYDGRNIEAAGGEASLPSRRILVLMLDARGNLWIGTDAGAARWRNGNLEPLEETRGRSVTGISAAKDGEVALVTSRAEIFHFREKSDAAVRSESAKSAGLTVTKLDQSFQPLLKSPNQPNELLQLTSIARMPLNPSDKGSGQWVVGSNGRGALLNKETDLREATTKPPRPYFVSSVYEDAANSVVWLGEKANEQAGGLWALGNGSLTRAAVDSGAVTAIHGGDGELWVGTNRRGAFLLKSQHNAAELVEHLTFENTAGGLRSDHVNSIFRDREGIVWFGTDRGVCRYDRESFRATTISHDRQSNYIRSLLETKSGEVWSGTNRGLFKLVDSGSSASAVEVSELQTRAVYDLFEDEAGAVWAATSSGLFVKAKNALTFFHVASPPETTITIADETTSQESPSTESSESGNLKSQIPNPKSRESVRAVTSFRGHIYAAFYERGIERLDGDKRVPVLTDLAAQQAICLTAEGDQALWFGTPKGDLWRYDGSQLKRIDLPGKLPNDQSEWAVRTIAFAAHRIWLGTSHGLVAGQGNEFRQVVNSVDVRDLFISHETSGDEVVWCATQNAGLIKLLPDKNISIRFDTEQGLASQQVFALAARRDSTSGELWIGTNRGVVHHRPSAVEPRLAIRRLVAGPIYLPEDLQAELTLPHTQRNFLLEVAGLGSKTFPSQFQYEFTLQNRRGQELKRLQTHDPQFAVGDLQSGAYVIVARSISRDLVYSAPLTIRLRIQNAPFPWGTLLLASLLAVAVAAAIWAFRQQLRLSKTNRTLAETNVELHETRLRLANETETERSRIARDLHDQTLADLRHLLVLTDQLPPSTSATSDDSTTPSPSVIRREIEAVSKEIRRICEDLSPSALENIGFLPALEWALSDAVAHLPAEEKFAYEFVCEPELEDRLQLSQIEQIQLYRIVQEALNNICRHAHARQVLLSVKAEKDDLVIAIRDDGKGFDGSSENKTGHGLANICSRANLIGAQVSWREARPGCHFEVRKAQAIKSSLPFSQSRTTL